MPEEIGSFRLHHVEDGPYPGWKVSWDGQWLSGLYEDRDACLVVIGLMLVLNRILVEGGLSAVEGMARAQDDTNITVDDVVRHFEKPWTPSTPGMPVVSS